MTRSKQNGFTLIELLVVITIIGILAAIALPNYIKAKDKAKEAEVKSACHTIQIALERYATDHSGKYPKQIYGGDTRGWSPEIISGWPYGCWAVWKAVQSKWPIPFDPLVNLGYVETYPDNAFIDPGEGRTSVIFWTGGSQELGLGDPRFGFTGEIMGNCLNDPRYLWESTSPPGPGHSTILGAEQYHIYDWIGTQQNYTAMVQGNTPNNPFYSMGGLPQWSRTALGQSDLASGQTINAFWAGEFFYRSGGDFFIVSPTAAATGEFAYDDIWDMPFQRITRYILGGFGSPRTQGVDVIRLTKEDGTTANNMIGYLGDNVYVTHQDFCDQSGAPFWEVNLSTPECMGGGSRGTNPTFPYWQTYNREWLYGAPDGYKDGVIITLISGSDSHKFGDS